ncbi:MAG TPA: nucleotidyl transferase AbiEii/AbiGii toxin family protein [Clostridiales bacterium]|nr:nucleotidyl transferase AbiEii/AbiGii toxin family protein [Clostridiales bacterium]HPV01590.1 nucleotidyl transferase AbiEii/AbiGii toxin family protein [Clostridiales bacterium]
MTKPIKNMAASVRSRLMHKAKEMNMTFDEIMTLYMLERMLYRLSVSRYCNQFVLKGGLFLNVLFEEQHRTTKDADLLAKQLSNQLDIISNIFSEICSLDCNDGLIFDSDNLRTVRIREDADYEGVRVNVVCYLGQAKKELQI